MIDIRTAANPRVPRSISNVTLSPSAMVSGAEEMWKKYFFAAVGILYEAVAFRGGEILDAPCGGQYFHFLLFGCRNLDLRDVYLRLGFDILGAWCAVCRSRPHRLSYPRKNSYRRFCVRPCVFAFPVVFCSLSFSRSLLPVVIRFAILCCYAAIAPVAGLYPSVLLYFRCPIPVFKAEKVPDSAAFPRYTELWDMDFVLVCKNIHHHFLWHHLRCLSPARGRL